MTEIIVVADGEPWQGFTSLTITENMNAAFNTLVMSTTDRSLEGIEVWNVRNGSEVDVYIDGEHVFKGDVNRYKPSIKGRTHSLTISAATRARDLVQSSHTGSLNFKTGDTPEGIINLITAPFTIPVHMPVAMSGLDLDADSLSYNIRAGTKAFDAVRRIADKDGLTVFTDSQFRLSVSDGTGYGVNASLTTGDYINLDVDHDIGVAYSEVIIRSQWKNKKSKTEKRPVVSNYVHDYSATATIDEVIAAGAGTLPSAEKENPKKRAFAETQQTQVGFKNTAQTRYRPLMFLNNEKPDAEETYASYLNRRFAGQMVTATVDVKSLLDKDGAPWQLANMVNIFEPTAELNDTLIISGRTISVTPDTGLTITLALSSPEAYMTGVVATPSRRRSVRRASASFAPLLKALVEDL